MCESTKAEKVDAVGLGKVPHRMSCDGGDSDVGDVSMGGWCETAIPGSRAASTTHAKGISLPYAILAWRQAIPFLHEVFGNYSYDGLPHRTGRASAEGDSR